uniref:RNA-directed DNA polymerase, eukaryota n=1 Tax=Tanacetum cinerariifolium TaxID=118510 RepID=A0A699H0E3_TANCI|nr:RNA-directed DNA polymerase, eukaryota [Tanacetum cinerariifolium]
MDNKQYEGPFNIYELLNKKKVNDNEDVQSEDNLKYPLGFTPRMYQKVFLKKAKKDWVKELCYKHKFNFLTLQETKMENIDLRNIMMIWGNFTFEFDISSSIGNSGGVRVPSFSRMLIISVYAPQEVSEKKMLWNYLNDLVDKWNGKVVIMGDFNEVRTRDERFGSCFHEQGAEAFNLFIALGGLLDVPLGGYRFTWSLNSASKVIDYGPVPFRLYHYWFNLEGFDKMLEDTWNEEIYQGDNDVELVAKQTNIMNSIHDIERLENTELTQKAKVKWAIKGDENSRYFHGIINKKRVQLAIRELQFPHRITIEQRLDMEKDITYDERYWRFMGSDIVAVVNHFFQYGQFPKGAKIPANRLCGVLGDIVNEVQSAFVANRQILDGPFMLNELISWSKNTRTQTMMFKVDFEKDYDSKSKVMGIGVSSDQVKKPAYQIGCVTFTPLFSYLGVKVGGMMSRNSTWNEVIQRLLDWLSKWKMQKLSIGGRLTLLKSVLGSMHTYHIPLFKTPMKVLNTMESIRSKFFNGMEMTKKKMVWVRWSNVLDSKQKGGLGVSSFYALNRALIFKWVPFSKFLVVGASH